MATPSFISDGNISQLLLLKARLIGLMQTRYFFFLTIFGTRSSMVMQRCYSEYLIRNKPNIANYFNFFIAKAYFYFFIIIYVYVVKV